MEYECHNSMFKPLFKIIKDWKEENKVDWLATTELLYKIIIIMSYEYYTGNDFFDEERRQEAAQRKESYLSKLKKSKGA
jgi:hypothetical protein